MPSQRVLDIKKRQKERLAKIKAARKAKRARKAKAAASVNPAPAPVAAPPPPAKKVKVKKEKTKAKEKYTGKPFNGDKAWILSPPALVALATRGLRKVNFRGDEGLQAIGRQLDVRDTSKDELIQEILKIARREVRKAK